MADEDDLAEIQTHIDEQFRADVVEATPSATDPKTIERQRKKKEIAEDNYTLFWKRVLGDKIGREVMFTLLKDCGIFQFEADYTPAGFPSTEKTWFALGKRSIGEALRDRLELTDHDLFREMYNEHHPAFMKPKKRKKPDDGE